MPKPENSGPKFIGSSLILAGTAIGAGMLALPLVSAKIGLLPMLLVFLVVAFFSATSALLTLEANLAIKPGCNLYTMASHTLGRVGKTLATVTPLCLFYSLMWAYLSGGGALLSKYIHGAAPEVTTELSVLAFSLVAGFFVYWSTSAVDFINRVLFGLMIVIFGAVLVAIAPSARYEQLFSLQEIESLPLLAALPIVFTSFGYHGSIPSIVLYQKHQHNQEQHLKKLPKIFFLATIIPLTVYIVWLIMVHGVLPEARLLDISNSSEALAILIEDLSLTKRGNIFLHAFSDLALFTSVLGVALGLFHYLAGLCQRSDSRWHRLQTVCMTFVPPLALAIIFPGGFITALGYAAVALSILAILLPSAIVYTLRKRPTTAKQYSAPGGLWTIYSCVFFGCLIILSQLVSPP